MEDLVDMNEIPSLTSIIVTNMLHVLCYLRMDDGSTVEYELNADFP